MPILKESNNECKMNTSLDFQINDRVELVDNHSDRITYKEYELAKQEIDIYYNENGIEPLEEVNEQDMLEVLRESGDTEEQIQEYMNEHKRNNPSIRYTCTKFEIQQYLQNFMNFDLLKRQVSNKTHCTIGGPAVVYMYARTTFILMIQHFIKKIVWL